MDTTALTLRFDRPDRDVCRDAWAAPVGAEPSPSAYLADGCMVAPGDMIQVGGTFESADKHGVVHQTITIDGEGVHRAWDGYGAIVAESAYRHLRAWVTRLAAVADDIDAGWPPVDVAQIGAFPVDVATASADLIRWLSLNRYTECGGMEGEIEVVPGTLGRARSGLSGWWLNRGPGGADRHERAWQLVVQPMIDAGVLLVDEDGELDVVAPMLHAAARAGQVAWLGRA